MCTTLIAFQAQLVAELGRMRGALLLAFPDQGRALREHGMPPKDMGAGATAGEAGAPLDDGRHQEWVQVGALAVLLPSGSLCYAQTGQRSLHSGQPCIRPSLSAACWHTMWTPRNEAVDLIIMLRRADCTTAAHQKHLWHMQAVVATQLTEQQQRTLLCIRAAYITNAVVLARRRPALTDQLQASGRCSASTQCMYGPWNVEDDPLIT